MVAGFHDANQGVLADSIFASAFFDILHVCCVYPSITLIVSLLHTGGESRETVVSDLFPKFE